MSRALILLNNDADRAKASAWIAKAPPKTRVEFKGPRRSIPQNDRLWAHLTDIASQKDWHGEKLTANQWKMLFLDALKSEFHAVPNLAGTGIVDIGRSSADLSKEEMSEFLALIEAWCAQNGVTLRDPVAA